MWKKSKTKIYSRDLGVTKFSIGGLDVKIGTGYSSIISMLLKELLIRGLLYPVILLTVH